MTPRHGRGHRRAHSRRRRSRTRWQSDDGTWTVNARIERFVEPALLLTLRDLPGHGYEIADEIEDLLGGERVDLGNLYRLLRSMEEEDLVESEWGEGESERGRRTYRITPDGEKLLDAWLDSLGQATTTIELFIARAHSDRDETEGDER